MISESAAVMIESFWETYWAFPFEKVKIIRREKDGLIIELEAPAPTQIPVSKTYVEDVFKAFGQSIN